MLYGLNYSKVLETVFSRGFIAQQQAGKFIPENFFARANCQVCVTWCDVTKANLCFRRTPSYMSYMFQVWKGKYGSWFALVNLKVSQICDHLNVIISGCWPPDIFLTHLAAILELKDTNIFNRLFSFVIGRPFDHVFEFQLRTHCLLFIWPLDFESSAVL